MTALASRRRTSTRQAAVAVAVAVALVVGLSVWGAATLASSTIGRAVEPGSTALRLPFTATGVLGVVDDDGHLASAVVIVLDPSGVGGSIVSIAPEADVASGRADSVVTLAEGVATGGESLFALDAESMVGIGIDALLLADVDRLADLLSPVGPITVGTDDLDVTAAAEILAGPGAGDPAAHLEADSAIWAALAAAVGEGVPALAGAIDSAPLAADATPTGMEPLLRRLFAGPVGHRMMPLRTLVPASDDAGAIVAHDWSEMLVVMAQVAPVRVAAPFAASTVRIVAPAGVDAAVEAVDRLGLAGLNVVSVDAAAGTVPSVTRILVGGPEALDDAGEFAAVFGPVETAIAERRVDGVDVIVELGESFNADLDRAIADDLVGSLFAP